VASRSVPLASVETGGAGAAPPWRWNARREDERVEARGAQLQLVRPDGG
jgi:hypothetical protein